MDKELPLEKQTDQEEAQDHSPKVMNDPDCKHYWVDGGLDPEGKGQASCKYCPMGRYFKIDETEVVDGRIIPRTN